MLQNSLKLYEIIKLNAPIPEFSTIFVMEKMKHLFFNCCKIQIFKPTDTHLKRMDFFQMQSKNSDFQLLCKSMGVSVS